MKNGKQNNNPKYPVFIISKGRWKLRHTSKALEKINVPYHIVIEPQEYEQYSQVINKEKILQLPFKNLGQGSIPARNWIWEYSMKLKAKRHWILDDNITHFFRFIKNKLIIIKNGLIFKQAEDFVDRYKNIALTGFQYETFIKRKNFYENPFILNTRIYSCILIKNDIPYCWRGRYNEDTDLSLRVLKDGWCTVLFYSFLCKKIQTMTIKGGNTDELYRQDKNFDGRLAMAQSLWKQHPDVTKIVWKWNRWQHLVNYKPFAKNRLILNK